jgi:Heterokaryon incompatibility protein (HET)
MNHEVYHYLRSDQSELRLLRLRAGQPEKEVTCDIFTISLSDNIEYEALSYAWGDKKDTRTMRLNGIHFSITINLEAALRLLRHTGGDRIMWVDAVCIDRENFQERSQQVRQLGQIYKQPQQVIIWLGPGTSTSDMTINGIEMLAKDPNLHCLSTAKGPHIEEYNR